MFKKLWTAIMLSIAVSACVASNEWNDTVIGYVGARPDGVVLAYRHPCPEQIAKKIPKKYRESFQYARFTNPAGLLNGCWMPIDDKGVVIFLWEDGSYGWMYQYKFNLLRST
jgi:hypothetical protein